MHGKLYAVGDNARAAVRPAKIDGPGADERWYKNSVAFTQRYEAAPSAAVVVDSDDPRMLAIAVALAVGTWSPLLLPSDQPQAYLEKTSGVTDRVYVVGSATPGPADELSTAIG